MAAAQPLVFMLLMFAVFWFILIRPQVKRQKKHTALLNALKKGDRVVTRGGLIAKISGVSDTILTLELQEKVRVRVLRSHVETKFDPAVHDKKPASSAKAA